MTVYDLSAGESSEEDLSARRTTSQRDAAKGWDGAEVQVFIEHLIQSSFHAFYFSEANTSSIHSNQTVCLSFTCFSPTVALTLELQYRDLIWNPTQSNTHSILFYPFQISFLIHLVFHWFMHSLRWNISTICLFFPNSSFFSKSYFILKIKLLKFCSLIPFPFRASNTKLDKIMKELDEEVSEMISPPNHESK